jgi:hypothetical protein
MWNSDQRKGRLSKLPQVIRTCSSYRLSAIANPCPAIPNPTTAALTVLPTGMVTHTATQIKLRALCVGLLNLELSLSGRPMQGSSQPEMERSITDLQDLDSRDTRVKLLENLRHVHTRDSAPNKYFPHFLDDSGSDSDRQFFEENADRVNAFMKGKTVVITGGTSCIAEVAGEKFAQMDPLPDAVKALSLRRWHRGG